MNKSLKGLTRCVIIINHAGYQQRSKGIYDWRGQVLSGDCVGSYTVSVGIHRITGACLLHFISLHWRRYRHSAPSNWDSCCDLLQGEVHWREGDVFGLVLVGFHVLLLRGLHHGKEAKEGTRRRTQVNVILHDQLIYTGPDCQDGVCVV